MSADITTASGLRRIWVPGIIAALVAAAATTGGAALARTQGVTFADKTGASIPLPGFVTLTVVFSLVGVILAAVLDRTAKRPRSTFVRTTVVLVVLSYVPDLLPMIGFDAASAATLMALHTLAALIVIPTLARGLRA